MIFCKQKTFFRPFEKCPIFWARLFRLSQFRFYIKLLRGASPLARPRKSQKALFYGYWIFIFYDSRFGVPFSFFLFRFPCRKPFVCYETLKSRSKSLFVSLIKRSSTHWCQPFQRSGFRVMTIVYFLCSLYQLTLSTNLPYYRLVLKVSW